MMKQKRVLPSITNKSFTTIAKIKGWKWKKGGKKGNSNWWNWKFDEVLAVGTDVVVTPLGSVTTMLRDGSDEKKDQFGISEEVRPITRKLYDHGRAIQIGDEEDKNGWNFKIE